MNAVAAEAVNRGSIQHPGELAELLEILAEEPPERAVEVGVAFGGTLWALSQVCGSVVGIDRDLSLVDKRNSELPLLEGDSTDGAIATAALALLGGPANFVFIDAAHEPEAMLADYEAWRPALASGGIIGFHDICGSAKVGWRELLARPDCSTVQGVRQISHDTEPKDRGIGLLRVP